MRDEDGQRERVAYASAVSLPDLYRRKALSPVEATRLSSTGSTRCSPGSTPSASWIGTARWRRRGIRGALVARRTVGRLDGVPVTIKDLILMRGFPTRRGSRLVEPDQDWSEDAPATARLREAGAVIIGKTTTPEFGWKALGDSPLTGITRNPWDLSRTPGGSSAGAAAACAAGIGPLHVGSDGAGSIRIPAAFTGIFGLKPSFGRVPAHPPSPMGLLAHIGPMARTVADAALLLTVLSGPDHRDPYALPPEDKDYVPELEEGVRGWRIAYSPTLGYAKVDPEIAAAAGEAARQFEALGAMVEQVDTIFDSPRDALFTLWAAGTANFSRGSRLSAGGDRPRPGRDGGGGRTDQRGRLSRRRRRPQCARPADGGVPPELRSAADADDAGSGLAGRAGSERSRDRAALDRLVAVQLSVQPDPSAGSQHPLRPDPRRVADRPADRRPALCR